MSSTCGASATDLSRPLRSERDGRARVAAARLLPVRQDHAGSGRADAGIGPVEDVLLRRIDGDARRARVPSRIRAGRGTPSNSSKGSAAAPAESGSTGTAAARSSRRASPSIHTRPNMVERRREPRLGHVLDAAQDCEPPPGMRQIRSGGEAVPKNAAALLHRG
jgi:hypothetical protein